MTFSIAYLMFNDLLFAGFKLSPKRRNPKSQNGQSLKHLLLDAQVRFRTRQMCKVTFGPRFIRPPQLNMKHLGRTTAHIVKN
jgi:hypothetical protein